MKFWLVPKQNIGSVPCMMDKFMMLMKLLGPL